MNRPACSNVLRSAERAECRPNPRTVWLSDPHRQSCCRVDRWLDEHLSRLNDADASVPLESQSGKG